MFNRNYNRRYAKDYGFIRDLYVNLFVSFIVKPIGLFFYTPKILGRENLEKGKRYMYTANHQSYIDPTVICYAINYHKIAFMAKEELFTKCNFLIKALVISLGAFSVNRDKPDISTFKTLKDIINKTNWSLGIFPQGKTCKGAKNFDDVKRGFVSIAKMAKMDVVPITICGYTGYSFIPFSKHLTVKIGKPISWELSEDEIYSKWVEYMNANIE